MHGIDDCKFMVSADKDQRAGIFINTTVNFGAGTKKALSSMASSESTKIVPMQSSGTQFYADAVHFAHNTTDEASAS